MSDPTDVFATSFGTLNYSGLLFNKGNTRTPLSTIIAPRAKVTNHVEFVTGLEYNTGTTASQPAISEAASLTAPLATIVTREQKTNVTQIFMESFGVSYAHMANMGTLAGLNAAGQQANPVSEFDFQLAAKMQKIRNDIEYTFINGAYQKAAADTTANKTCGLANAITTNATDMDGAPLGIWDVILMAKAIYGSNGITDDLCVWGDATTILQLNADAASNGLTVAPAARDMNGIALNQIVTPFGIIYTYIGMYLPSGTAFLLNLNVLAPVFQPVPGKGTLFVEELAKVGAGSKYQIYTEVGLDYGPEWYHGIWTDIATTFEAPAGKKVVIANTDANPVKTQEVVPASE